MKRLIFFILAIFCFVPLAQPTSAATVITAVDPVNSLAEPSITLNGSGFPIIAYNYQGTGMRVVVCGNATCSAGNTITTPDTGNVGWQSSIVLNASGFPVIAHHDDFNFDLRLLVCGNATCTAGNTNQIVTAPGFTGYYPSIQLNGSGFPVIAFSETLVGLRLVVCGNATCTAGSTFTTLNADVGA